MSTLHSSGESIIPSVTQARSGFSPSRFSNAPLSKQTLPLKAFLVTIVGLFGFSLSADQALQRFEARQRIEEAAVRKVARMELAKRGLVPTETEIDKWRTANGK